MLWHVFKKSKYFSSSTYSSTQTNETFLSWFLNVLTRIFGMSRGAYFLMYGNPKRCEVAEHISTKFEVNTWMLSTLKNEKFIWDMNPGGDFETSMVEPLVTSVTLSKRQIGKGYSKSGIFYGRPFISTFFPIVLSCKYRHDISADG